MRRKREVRKNRPHIRSQRLKGSVRSSFGGSRSGKSARERERSTKSKHLLGNSLISSRNVFRFPPEMCFDLVPKCGPIYSRHVVRLPPGMRSDFLRECGPIPSRNTVLFPWEICRTIAIAGPSLGLPLAFLGLGPSIPMNHKFAVI